MTPVQLFVCDSETQLEIEFAIKKPIKTQCKTPHPQPLSPSTGRGEHDQFVSLEDSYLVDHRLLYSKWFHFVDDSVEFGTPANQR